MPGNKTPVVKRIPYQNLSFESLVSKAMTLAAKHNMLAEKETPEISYMSFFQDGSSARTEVEDDDDVQLALNVA